MMDVDVVIVNYKSAAYTVNCVRTVRRVANYDGVNAKIIVVNNGDDAKLDNEIMAAGEVTVINNTSNDGYGAACNRGTALGKSKCILFLNSDTTLKLGALKYALNTFANPNNKEIGIIGPAIVSEDGALTPSCSRLPNLVDLLLRTIGSHVIFKNTGYPFLSLAAHEKSCEVGQVMGAALFIRRDLFVALGGFDEKLFLYYEDVDLCARSKTLGSICYYLKDSQVSHIGRVSSSQDTGLSLALHIHSRLIYAGIHFGRGSELLLGIITVLFEFPIRLLRASAMSGAMSPQSVLRAYRIFLTSVFSRKSRRALANSRHNEAV